MNGNAAKGNAVKGNAVKNKCFGMNVRGDCTCLNSKACMGFDICPFYKSRAKANADREKADARLRAMPMEHQTAIADKYYKGMMPWGNCV